MEFKPDSKLDSKTDLLNLDYAALEALCLDWGEPAFRARQLFGWVHQRLEDRFEAMSNLARSLREKLAERTEIGALPEISLQQSEDGVQKWLFAAGERNAIETVLIPEARRATLCLSTQAGCALGCVFCATGAQGFARNLSSAEILAQLRQALRFAAAAAPAAPQRAITNIVMMGMGEPLQNYSALIPALRVMLDDRAYGFSRRRLTVSTAGVAPMIERLAQDCPVSLAVSLHASDDALRNDLMPINRKYPLADLLAACRAYLAASAAPRDFITFEYCLLQGVNDSEAQARDLAALVQRSRIACKFNLIAFNPAAAPQAAASFRPSTPERTAAFAATLMRAGYVTTLRRSRGQGIAAACGQLAGRVINRLSRSAGALACCTLLLVALAGCAEEEIAVGADEGAASDPAADWGLGAGLMIPENSSPERVRLALRYLDAGLNYYRFENWGAALESANAAALIEPGLAAAHHLRALSHMQRREKAAAEENFRHALRLQNNQPDTLEDYGVFLCRNRRFDEGLKLLDEALAARHHEQIARTESLRGECFTQMGRAEEAGEALERAAKWQPNDPQITLRWAQWLYEQGRYAEAQDTLAWVNRSRFASEASRLLAAKIACKLRAARAPPEPQNEPQATFPLTEPKARVRFCLVCSDDPLCQVDAE